MERDYQRDSKRRREDTRDHKPRYQRDRSRSPAPRDRRDNNDRRRDRSPPPARNLGRSTAPDYPESRSRDTHHRRPDASGPLPRKPNDRNARDTRPATNGPTQPTSRPPAVIRDTNMQLDTDPLTEMQRVLGFSDFRSTKETKVPGNDKNWGLNKRKKTEYRQYMNRVGGFNRPLSPSRT